MYYVVECATFSTCVKWIPISDVASPYSCLAAIQEGPFSHWIGLFTKRKMVQSIEVSRVRVFCVSLSAAS